MIPKYRAYTEKHGLREVRSMYWTDRGLYVTLENGTGAPIRVKDPVLIRPTGAKDIEGTEIYAGHILGLDKHRSNFVDFLPAYGFILRPCNEILRNNGRFYPFTPKTISGRRITGNIYENKELMNE